MKKGSFWLVLLFALMAVSFSSCMHVQKHETVSPPVVPPEPRVELPDAPTQGIKKEVPPSSVPAPVPRNEVIVDLSTALICFAGMCHPALVGVETPRGEFQLIHYTTPDPGYGGDILSFKETRNALYCIHRVIDVRGQQRIARLKSPDPRRRRKITGGCVNVDPHVYDELVKCCYASKLVIK